MIDKALLLPHDQLIARPAETPKSDLPSMRISLLVKITFPFLVLSLILAAGAAYAVTQIVFDTIEERFTNQLIEGGKLASEWMVREEALAQITLYDFEGELVASTFFAGTDLDQDLASGVLSRQDAGSLQRDMEALRELSVGNIEYAGILGPWEVRGDADRGVMGISFSKAFLVTASNVTRVKVYLLASELDGP